MTEPKAKKPQDHKSAKSAESAELEIVTPRSVMVRGEEFTLLPSVADDFELLLDLARLQNAVRAGAELVSVMSMLSLFLRMVPDEEIGRAMALVRTESGSVPVESGTELMVEFIQAIDPNS